MNPWMNMGRFFRRWMSMKHEGKMGKIVKFGIVGL